MSDEMMEIALNSWNLQHRINNAINKVITKDDLPSDIFLCLFSIAIQGSQWRGSFDDLKDTCHLILDEIIERSHKYGLINLGHKDKPEVVNE
jgi:hypothetical protein